MKEIKKIKCTKCGEEYPATTDFYRLEPRKKNGFTSNCRKCSNKRRRERYREDKESGQYDIYYKENHLTYKSSSLRQRGYSNINKEKLEFLINNFKNKDGFSECPYCGRIIKDEQIIHFDHFYPYSKDKSDECDLINLVPVCKYCNRSKWDETFEEWYREQFFYNSEKEQKMIKYINDGELKPFF